MTKSEIEANISHLHAHLAEAPDLSEADKVCLLYTSDAADE